ncbi:MAG: NADPH-dependent FMN reductase [Patescibacteria group bacterium]
MTNKILLICGSAQEPSLNEKYLEIIEKNIAQRDGFETKVVRMRNLGLPLFLGYETSRGAAVEKWRETVAWADGFVIASPEYDHALPAVLKNSFEHLDGVGYRDKPVMLLGATTGRGGTLQAQHSLYPILRTYGAWLMPDELFIPRADKQIDGDGRVVEPALAKRIEELTGKFLYSVEHFYRFRNSL